MSALTPTHDGPGTGVLRQSLESALTVLHQLEHSILELRRDVRRLSEENEGLATEVLRVYEQLNLIFQFTQGISRVTQPAEIERSMIADLAGALDASRVCVLSTEGERVVRADPRPGACPARLSREIERELDAAVKRVLHAREVMVSLLGDEQVLMGPLPRLGDRVDLVVAARPASAATFTAYDMKLVETLLGFGSQILSNSELHAQVARMSREVTVALVSAIDKKDHYTSGHSERVGRLTRLTGAELGVSDEQLQSFEWAGLLHDVGKIGVPEEILRKPGALTAEEFAKVKRHPEMGYEILRPIASLQPVLEGVLYHHENPDGTGYPRGLRAPDIPLVARVIHVVDVFDALSSSRSYRAAFPVEQACDILRKDSGSKLDGEVVSAFLSLLDRMKQTQPDEFATLMERPGGAS